MRRLSLSKTTYLVYSVISANSRTPLFFYLIFFPFKTASFKVPILDIFAAYFYRGEFAELLFCHIVNVVDKGLRVVTMKDRFEADRQKALYRGQG